MAISKDSRQELTTGEVIKLTGLSKKELQALDELGILDPEKRKGQGIRLYDHQTLMRIEQFTFYEALEVPLEVTREILANVDLHRQDAVLDAQWVQLYTELDATNTRIACIEVCQALDQAGKQIAWGALTRLQHKLPAQDLNFWDEFQPGSHGQDAAFGDFDQVWSLYQTWKHILISAALYEQAKVQPDEPLAKSLGLARLNWRREVESCNHDLVERFEKLESNEIWLRQAPFEKVIDWLTKVEGTL